MRTREERIAKRRGDMPKVYRGIYDRAAAGNRLRAAVNSFCLECVCWQREEVRLCTALACPLYPYRPYQLNDAGDAISVPKTPPQGPDSTAKSTNSSKEDNYAG